MFGLANNDQTHYYFDAFWLDHITILANFLFQYFNYVFLFMLNYDLFATRKDEWTMNVEIEWVFASLLFGFDLIIMCENYENIRFFYAMLLTMLSLNN